MLEILVYLLRRKVNAYDRCPTCGMRWKARPSGRELELGAEMVRCNCGKIHATLLREWIHFDASEKKKYFLWNAEIQFVLIFASLPVILVYFTLGLKASLIVLGWAAGIGGLLVIIGGVLRSQMVRRSLVRQPRIDMMFRPGNMPWEW